MVIKFPSPHPGIINFFFTLNQGKADQTKFPSPHPGIINFFCVCLERNCSIRRFRPLIRGLSISSLPFINIKRNRISFRPLIRGLSISSAFAAGLKYAKGFPSPHPGIINFFLFSCSVGSKPAGFRPLIRGLSISSDRGRDR